MNTLILIRVVDWHGEQAANAYRMGDMEAFARHALIADRLWRAAQ